MKPEAKLRCLDKNGCAANVEGKSKGLKAEKECWVGELFVGEWCSRRSVTIVFGR